jgi:hypothetical protein
LLCKVPPLPRVSSSRHEGAQKGCQDVIEHATDYTRYAGDGGSAPSALFLLTFHSFWGGLIKGSAVPLIGVLRIVYHFPPQALNHSLLPTLLANPVGCVQPLAEWKPLSEARPADQREHYSDLLGEWKVAHCRTLLQALALLHQACSNFCKEAAPSAGFSRSACMDGAMVSHRPRSPGLDTDRARLVPSCPAGLFGLRRSKQRFSSARRSTGPMIRVEVQQVGVLIFVFAALRSRS